MPMLIFARHPTLTLPRKLTGELGGPLHCRRTGDINFYFFFGFTCMYITPLIRCRAYKSDPEPHVVKPELAVNPTSNARDY